MHEDTQRASKGRYFIRNRGGPQKMGSQLLLTDPKIEDFRSEEAFGYIF